MAAGSVSFPGMVEHGRTVTAEECENYFEAAGHAAPV